MSLMEHESKTEKADVSFDSSYLSKFSSIERISKVDPSKVNAMVSMGSIKDNTQIQFVTQGSIPKISGLRVNLSIAFKVGTDMNMEKKSLETECKKLQSDQKKQDE